jgi:uncharacterized protein (TIGR03382 family)
VTSSSSKTTSTSARLDGLENGTTYDVWVVAYSEAGNESAASELTFGTPVPVKGFWEVYQESGGVERGGCGAGGGGPALLALPLVLLALRRRPRAAAALVLASACTAAWAGEPGDGSGGEEAEPAHGSFALRLEWYRPAIDAEFGGAATPFALSIGEGRAPMYRAEWARELDLGGGALELGAGAGYYRATGRGLYLDETGAWARSGDSTALTLVPLSVFAGGRLTLLRRFGVPLEPYARISLARYEWWTTGTSQATVHGATSGYALTAGLALRLDDLDPGSARELAREAGIRGTAITVDLSRSGIDDFGSRTSWDLSDPGWTVSGGLKLAF